MVDQGFYSGGNFVVNIWLINKLSPEDYGNFAIAFSLFLVLSGVQNALVLEPVAILGAPMIAENTREYLSLIYLLHGLVCIIVAALTIMVVLVLPPMTMGSATIAMAAFLPISLLYWLSRRVSYMLAAPGIAAIASATYLVALLLSLLALSEIGHLNGIGALGAFALASLSASLMVLWRLPIGLSSRINWSEFRTLLVSHWRLGRWVAVQTVANLGAIHLSTFLAAAALSVAVAGQVRALGLLAMPMQLALGAVGGMLVLPVLSHEFASGRVRELRKKASLVTIGGTLAAICYLCLLLIWRDSIGDFITPGEDSPPSWLIPAVGIGTLMSAMGGGANLALRASRKVAHYPILAVYTVLFSVAVTPFMVLRWEVSGAVLSNVIGVAFGSLLSVIMYRLWVKELG